MCVYVHVCIWGGRVGVCMWLVSGEDGCVGEGVCVIGGGEGVCEWCVVCVGGGGEGGEGGGRRVACVCVVGRSW